MPNWCNNKLEIEDCSPELAAYLQENGLSFDKIKPTPPEMLDDEQGSWYGWRVANWGTKWDLSEQEQRETADWLLSDSADFTACFDTAWDSPRYAIAALSAMFPNDRFVLHYLELGMFFAGTAYISNGEIDEGYIPEDEESIRAFALEVFDYDLSEAYEE